MENILFELEFLSNQCLNKQIAYYKYEKNNLLKKRGLVTISRTYSWFDCIYV